MQELKINKLLNKIQNNKDLKEVIFATNLTASGMLTAKLIYKECINLSPNLKYSRIGFGLPLNSSIDYADNETMSYSLNNRTNMK